ncbi:hypothetical protein SDC9_20583 [bioreactor metagenome]|uniref:Uncharacterized protein n=1 Tax=bioreactor metagenome TaxID=1076179 RepID=A0A644U756_9ZZZZ
MRGFPGAAGGRGPRSGRQSGAQQCHHLLEPRVFLWPGSDMREPPDRGNQGDGVFDPFRGRGGQHLRDCRESGLGIEHHDPHLPPHDGAESLDRQCPQRGLELEGQIELSLVNLLPAHADPGQGADHGFEQAALADLPTQCGDLACDEVAMFGRRAGLGADGGLGVAVEPGQRRDEGRVIHPFEGPLVPGVAQVAPGVEIPHDGVRHCVLRTQEGIVRIDRRAMRAHLFGRLTHQPGQRVAARPVFVGHPRRMQCAHQFHRLRRDRGPHPMLRKVAVKPEVDLGQPRHGRETAVACGIVGDDLADVVEAAPLDRHDVIALGQLVPRLVCSLVADDGLIDPRRQQVDQLDVAGELAVLLAPHGGGDEDAEMADAFVHRVDDGLVVRQDLSVIGIHVSDPAERLRRWRDVVALRAEHHDRRPDVAQIDPDSVGGDDLARAQPVADEQVVDHVLHLDVVQEDMAAPVFLEAEVARRLGVDFRPEGVALLPERVGRVEVLEILYQRRTVEPAAAEVACERAHPCPAEQPARIAHRVLAFPPGPVGQRCPGDDDRAKQVGPDGCGHQDLPSRLAIADDRRFLAARMQRDHLFEEGRFGAHHILGGLARDGFGQKANEIARVTEGQRHADLALGLEAADAGAVAGARVDDDERALFRIGRHITGQDARQPVVDRVRQVGAVHHRFERKIQNMRCRLLDMGAILVAAHAPHIGIENRALRRIDDVVPCLLEERGGSIGHWCPGPGGKGTVFRLGAVTARTEVFLAMIGRSGRGLGGAAQSGAPDQRHQIRGGTDAVLPGPLRIGIAPDDDIGRGGRGLQVVEALRIVMRGPGEHIGRAAKQLPLRGDRRGERLRDHFRDLAIGSGQPCREDAVENPPRLAVLAHLTLPFQALLQI